MARVRFLFVAFLIPFLAACRGTPTPMALPPAGTPAPRASSALPSASTPTRSPEPVDRAGPFQHVAALPAEAGSHVRIFLSSGDLQLLGDETLHRLAGFGWETVLEGFPGVPVGLDRAGRLWVIPPGGEAITVWDGGEWVLHSAESGWEPLADPRASLATDPAGGVWLVTRQDVRVFDGDLWKIFSPMDLGLRATGGEASATLTLQFASETETVWVGECDLAGPGPVGGAGARWWDGGRWHRGPNDEGCVLAIDEAPNGEVWVGVDERLWSYDQADQKWTEHELPSLGDVGRPEPFILDLTFGPRGELWALVALCGGASCSGNETLLTGNGDEWVTVGQAGMFVSPPTFDGRGTAWLPTATGVYRVRNHAAEHVADLQVLSFAVDDGGRLWLAARYEGRPGLWVQSGP